MRVWLRVNCRYGKKHSKNHKDSDILEGEKVNYNTQTEKIGKSEY